MADRGNQALPPSQSSQVFSPQGGQSKPPDVTANGPFPPGSTFPPNPAASQPSQWSGAPPRLPPANVNGFTAQPQQQPRMPVNPGGFPPRPGFFSQSPSGQAPPRPPAHFPPPPTSAPASGQFPPPSLAPASGQFSPPSSSVPQSGPQMNGSGSMNIRPPPNMMPPVRPMQTSGLPSSSLSKEISQPSYGGLQSPPVQLPPSSSSNSGQAPFTAVLHGSGTSGPGGDSIQSAKSGKHYAIKPLINNGRPNELPVPFHGQGQYSHQVNPFMQKTPTPTPSNSEPPSERSSRGPSPISGSTFDALEGQFTSGHGASLQSFPGNRGSPIQGMGFPGANNTFVSGQVPSTPPAGTFTASQQGQATAAVPGPSGFTLPPFSATLSRPPTESSQFQAQPPSLYQGQRHPVCSGFPPPTSNQPAGLTPASNQAPGFPPASVAQPRYPAPPPASAVTGYPRPPLPNTPGLYPAPNLTSMPSTSGFLPPPTAAAAGTVHPGQQQSGPSNSQYGIMPSSGPNSPAPGSYPTPFYGQPGQPQTGPVGYPNSVNTLSQNLAHMGIQDSQRVINLLNERHLIPPDGLETPKPILPHDHKKTNCSPDIFRCTLNAVPQTSALLSKARLPLGILIHPFKDLSQLPVIQSSVIVRCRSCRTYINPFVVFIDQRRWKCNLCFRVNDLPDEFSFDPVSKSYGEPQRRPEVKSATIEFIAPSEYMLRPPQPAVYLFLLDVSFNAVETGYLSQFCQILEDELDKLPGDARTAIGFLCYDSTLYYFNLAEGLSQPQMLCVPDLEDPFLPCPDNLLVNLHESRELVTELLKQLPNLFAGNVETGSALGAALQSAHKLMSPTGGRITVMQTCLPTVGPGALQNKLSGGELGKNVTNIGPATDFYKKLSLDCSAQQIAVDLFMLNGQYADIATLSCISKYSAGSICYYPSFHSERNPGLAEKFDADLRRYLTRKIGFESVMRIRCTRGLSIHTFHGNFFVRSTDLLSLPNINPDAGFGMQMSIEDTLAESGTVSFQAALLYTSSKGERRIRVHTLCVPVTNQLSEVFAQADQQAIAALLAKMAVDRSLNSALSDARDAMMNASLDALMAYAQQIPASQRAGALMAPFTLRLMPVFMLAMLKNLAFSLAGNTKLDDRVFAMQQCKVLPVCYMIQSLYPHLYPLHKLSDENLVKRGNEEIPSAPLLQLSSANIDRTGLFLMDTGEAMFLLVGSGVGDQICQEVFDKPNFLSIPEGMMDLPELENPTSERIRSFVNYLIDSRPHGITFLVIRDDSKNRHLFFQHMIEDRAENSMSYYEFLQFLQGKMKA